MVYRMILKHYWGNNFQTQQTRQSADLASPFEKWGEKGFIKKTSSMSLSYLITHNVPPH